MQNNTDKSVCLNCERDDHQVPLLLLKLKGRQWWICPQCLPTLIHKPQELAARLSRL